MERSLITEINTEINLKEEFASWLGVALANIPAELLDEALGGALGMTSMGGMGDTRREARRGEQEWRAQAQGGKEAPYKPTGAFRDPTKGGAPEMMQNDAVDVGDFVVVQGRPVKVVDKQNKFGGNEFVYLQGMQKPIIVDRLTLDKKVGKVKVFSVR